MDERDFDDFARSSIPGLVRFGRALTLDLGRAEDLVQTALMRTHQRWSRLSRPGQQPLGYTKKVMVNEEISRRRRFSSRERTVDELPERPTADLTEGVAAQEDLRRLVRRLPPRQRAVVVLRYYEDAADREIAELMGCTESTVRSLAAKALATLRISTQAVPEQVEESA